MIGIEAPEAVDGVVQQRVDGASLSGTFTDPDAPSPRRTQYFEMHGSRAIYHDGWKATTDYVSPLFGERGHLTGSRQFGTDHWSLFDLDHDFAEADDLSGAEPDRAAAMEQMWWAEAGRNQVLPLFEGPPSLVALHPAEYPPPAVATFEPGSGPIYDGVLPSTFGGFTVAADVVDGTDGILCALGDLNDGFAFYLLSGCPVATIVSGGSSTHVAADGPVGSGPHSVALACGAGRVTLAVDGAEVASEVHLGMLMFPAVGTAAGGLLIGRDRGLSVSDDYSPPFPFDGELRQITFSSGLPGSAPPVGEEIRRAQTVD